MSQGGVGAIPARLGTGAARQFLPLRPDRPRAALLFVGLVAALAIEGALAASSYVVAGAAAAVLLAAIATEVPLVPTVGFLFVLRALGDDSSSATSRHSSSVNLSALIAAVFILLAIGLLVQRRRELAPILIIAGLIVFWIAVATVGNGASGVTVREGVRELSILSLAVLVLNADGVLTPRRIARLVQLAGIAGALLAIYQLGTHTGTLVAGEVRANGTFSHPNDAAVYFAIAATASLWLWVDNGRRWFDLAAIAVFATATLATFSLGGFSALLVMFIAFGLLRSGSLRLKVRSAVLVVGLALVFLATPLGSERIANETGGGEAAAAATSQGEAGSSLAWRFYKWQTLIPEWEQAPLLGRGLGTTVLAEATSANTTVGDLPHNEYVRYLVETGALGMIAFLTGIVLLVRALNRRRRLAGLDNAAGFALAVVIGLLVNGLAANTLLYTPAACAAAMIVAAVPCFSPRPGGTPRWSPPDPRR